MLGSKGVGKAGACGYPPPPHTHTHTHSRLCQRPKHGRVVGSGTAPTYTTTVCSWMQRELRHPRAAWQGATAGCTSSKPTHRLMPGPHNARVNVPVAAAAAAARERRQLTCMQKCQCTHGHSCGDPIQKSIPDAVDLA